MSACPEKIVEYMHDFLDGDISSENEREMQRHIEGCVDCQRHMNELHRVESLISSVAVIDVAPPVNFVQNVMARLPKPKMRSGARFWLRQHPFLVAAAIFFILMSASLLSGVDNSSEFSVTDNKGLVVEGDKVTVPANETIKGDIVVKNGDLIVKGKVEGNVTVVNGQYMASTANVTGHVEKIDETFEWLWYSMKEGAKKIFSFD